MPWWARALLLAGLVVAGSWGLLYSQDRLIPLPDPASPISLDVSSPHGARYVGAANCRSCHPQAYDNWRGSHHDLAMQVATPQTVLGDFNHASVTLQGVASTFTRKADQFIVRTEGDDGQMRDYGVKYVFGVTPLQQYLVEFPGGKLQTLPLCWDSRPKEQGGQRWFHIYGNERIPPGDPLFWTGANQNWNFMCAECHSTNLKKNFDADTQTYRTSWSEINVACEACHGPGSDHLSWARGKSRGQKYPETETMGLVVQMRDIDPRQWAVNPATTLYEPNSPDARRTVVETCARCHARRETLANNYAHGLSIHDTHRVEPLSEGMYHSDGQILEEVYEFGSFTQSRMYHKGVKCIDCHDAHSVKLKLTGNALCLQCHKPSYSLPEHHFHPKPGAGTNCVDCHMMQRTYMQVDPRRDHSFRIPRPDLSVKFGAPNTCNDCHKDQTNQWSADWISKWYGSQRKPDPKATYATAIDSARKELPNANELIVQIAEDRMQPGISRATAMRAVRSPTRRTVGSAVQLLRDRDPMVRIAALEQIAPLPPAQRWTLAADLLGDPIKSVRLEAVITLAAARSSSGDSPQSGLFDKAADEYVAAYSEVRDRASGYCSLAHLQEELGQDNEALALYQQAVEIEPWFVPGVVNYASLQHRLGRTQEAHQTLLNAVKRLPEAALLHHELGLSHVRLGQTSEALRELQQAAELSPQEAQFGYTYAVALHSSGQPGQAISVLQKLLETRPHHAESLFALASFFRDAGNRAEAVRYAQLLRESHPDDPRAAPLLQSLGAGD